MLREEPTAESAQSSVIDRTPYQPTPRDLIMLDLPTGIKVAPTGDHAAISVRTTNWQANCYETICYLHDVISGAAYPLNRSGSVNQVEWVDGQTVALLKEGPAEGAKAQIWLYEGLVGDGWAVTDHETGVDWFMPFAGGFLYRANRADNDDEKARAADYGAYTHFEQEESKAALYYVELAAWKAHRAQLRRVTDEEAKQLSPPVVELSRLLPTPCAIRQVIPCPTGNAIYLNCWRRDDLVYYHTTVSYRITLDAPALLAQYQQRQAARSNATEKTKAEISDLAQVVQLALPAGATVSEVAPDGKRLLIAHQGRDAKIYTRSDLWLLDRDAALAATDGDRTLAQMRNRSAPLDRDLMTVQWCEQGIFGSYVDGTISRLAHFDEAGTVTPLAFDAIYPTSAFHVGAEGALGFVGQSAAGYPEAYLTRATHLTPPPPTRLTTIGDAVVAWQLGTVETIRWQSKDGSEIEGVLRKPANFDPTKRYPLVFVVHGGPRGVSEEALLSHTDRMYYPAIQFANAEMLVLYPNYRGSTGRGQAFTELNVNNLGVGDLWDIESAIDHLAAEGWVDERRIGCMGWSQGGYISAFAGLHSARFAAVSVGAGISDWYTYHISNDVPYFTTDYLSGSPFHNREHYAPTAPMSNLVNAKTPMLIQHGSEDRRVPLSNAMELYRGLQAMGVPVELYIYPGMGHPITKPRENHAVMSQNWAWFARYLLGEGAVDVD